MRTAHTQRMAGKPRREQRRYVKRAERAAWKRDMLKTLMEGN